ncbi:unnamed protein product [Schistosoma turkestanicum]|nr:unnamed protein product [Schistosoma turkestanicum]
MSRIIVLQAHTRKLLNHYDIKSKQENRYKLLNNFQQLSIPLRFEENDLLNLSNQNDDLQVVNNPDKLRLHFNDSAVNVSNTDGQQRRISKAFYPVNVNGLLIWNLCIDNKPNEIILCPETFQIWLTNQKIENIKVHLSWNDQLHRGILSLQFQTNFLNDSNNNNKQLCRHNMKSFNYEFIISALCFSEISLLVENEELNLDPLQLIHIKSFMDMSTTNWTTRYVYHS